MSGPQTEKLIDRSELLFEGQRRTLNVTRLLRYGGERWWKLSCMVVATGASASRHIDLVGTDWLEVSNYSWCSGMYTET